MDIVLTPGLWLDASSWDDVAEQLAAAGHRPHPLTLPGLESPGADRSQVGLADHVGAVVDAIDACGPEPVLLVGHSAGCGIVHAAADARPDRVARVIHVGGFPVASGQPLTSGFVTEGSDLPLPPWGAFDTADLRDLSESDLVAFRDRAIPSPAALTADLMQLGDERRFAIPVTMVCPEYTAEALLDWVGQGALAEVSDLVHVEYVDLPTGHWPQFTRPDDLAGIIAERAHPTVVDGHGRLQPPLAAGEALTLASFLDHQRQTFAWKTRGLDHAGLNATTASSSLTLGGLLKHLALVEENWFSHRLHGREMGAPWDGVDWESDPDWQFRSAADDTPEELRELWGGAVERSRALLAAALAEGDLDQMAEESPLDPRQMNLRWILVHVIEEYSRHNGHADLLRESIDGVTGE